MKHVYKISLALLLYVTVVILVKSFNQPAPTLDAATVGATPVATSSGPPPAAPDPMEVRLTAEHIRHLEGLARQREQMQVAATQMLAYRRQAQSGAYTAWKQVLATNHAAYLELRAQAKQSPHGETPCTLCDGMSYTPCVLCQERDGKCVTCRGSGRLVHDALCPACLGSGQCYLCTGSGKMFCPFCNDGMIDVRRPPPPNFPPLE